MALWQRVLSAHEKQGALLDTFVGSRQSSAVWLFTAKAWHESRHCRTQPARPMQAWTMLCAILHEPQNTCLTVHGLCRYRSCLQPTATSSVPHTVGNEAREL